MAKRKEGDLNKAIIKYVQVHENKGLAYVIRNNTIKSAILRDNGKTGWIVNGKKGSPDLVLCVAGRFVGCESKLRNGVQSPQQKEAQRRIENAGGLYWIVRTIDDFITHFQGMISHGEKTLRQV